MRNFFRNIRKRRFSYESLVEVLIHKENILHNLEAFRHAAPQWQFAPVLKSNAYGHGLVEVASILNADGDIPFFVIDSYYEALILRNENITKPLLIIGYTLPANISKSRLREVAWTVGSTESLENLVMEIHKPIRIHIKFDTGMHRQGILLNELQRVIELVKQNKDIYVEGICSHFASSDELDMVQTQNQIKAWNTLVEDWKKEFPNTKYYHVSNSAGTRYVGTIQANVGRLGLGLYGVDSCGTFAQVLKPVLEMKTRISSVKQIPQRALVGYGGTFRAPTDMTIATMPGGYAEGVDRRLSSKGSVLVNGIQCPIIGRVSMNITTIDVSNVRDISIGNEVTVISSNLQDSNTIIEWARVCGAIPHELLVHIPDRLRRAITE